MLENPEFIAAVMAVLTGFGSLLTAGILYVKNRDAVTAIRDARCATKVKRDDDFFFFLPAIRTFGYYIRIVHRGDGNHNQSVIAKII